MSAHALKEPSCLTWHWYSTFLYIYLFPKMTNGVMLRRNRQRNKGLLTPDTWLAESRHKLDLQWSPVSRILIQYKPAVASVKCVSISALVAVSQISRMWSICCHKQKTNLLLE
jgi:hypothetical protein